MTLRKVADAPPPLCRHPEHLPPSHIVLEPGLWEHACPACGEKVLFRVHRPTFASTGLPPEPVKIHAWTGGDDGRRGSLM